MPKEYSYFDSRTPGLRRCRTCTIAIKTEVYYCPCCGMKFPTLSRRGNRIITVISKTGGDIIE